MGVRALEKCLERKVQSEGSALLRGRRVNTMTLGTKEIGGGVGLLAGKARQPAI